MPAKKEFSQAEEAAEYIEFLRSRKVATKEEFTEKSRNFNKQERARYL